MKLLMTFLSGLLFGLGLIVSGMTNPSKVQGFLDLAGNWDPSLALVMGGALLVGSIAFPFAMKKPVALLGEKMRLPAARHIDRHLVLGSFAFGIGWGLAGYCPGPALVALGQGNPGTWVFLAAMFCGFAVVRWTTGIAAPAGRRA